MLPLHHPRPTPIDLTATGSFALARDPSDVTAPRRATASVSALMGSLIKKRRKRMRKKKHKKLLKKTRWQRRQQGR